MADKLDKGGGKPEDVGVDVGKVIRIDEGLIKNQLSEFVRDTVEVTLNGLLDAEADELCGAKRYEHTEERKDTRAGHYTLGTKAGEVTLKVPKLRSLPFETAIIEKYKRREISVEEALVQMYLAGVSVRRIEDITEALWGTRVSPATVSKLNQKVYERIEEWRNRPIEGEYAYLYLDGLSLKRSWGGEVANVSILVAIGVNRDGFREVLGVAEGLRENLASWGEFLRRLVARGLKGVKLVISDRCIGLVESVAEIFPEAKWQRCIVHFYRNVFTMVPRGKMREVATMLKAIHEQEDRAEAEKKAAAVSQKLMEMKLSNATEIVREGSSETFAYYDFPSEHRRKIRTNNPMERLMREIKRRTRVVGSFPDGKSALMLVAARLRHVASCKWGTVRYMNMDRIYGPGSMESQEAG